MIEFFSHFFKFINNIKMLNKLDKMNRAELEVQLMENIGNEKINEINIVGSTQFYTTHGVSSQIDR